MKTNILMLSAILTLFCSCEKNDVSPNPKVEVFYYYGGEKIFLTQRSDQIFVRLAADVDCRDLLSYIDADPSVKLSGPSNEIFGVFATLEAKNSKPINSAVLNRYRERPEIVSAQFALEYEGRTFVGLIDEFVLKLKPTTSSQQLHDLVSETGCVIVQENEFVKNQYLISTPKTLQLNALQMANLFYETGLFEFSEPNFCHYIFNDI